MSGDLLDGANMKSYAVEWLGSLDDRHEIADRVSPMDVHPCRTSADPHDPR